jgi:hypothetical protein
VLICVCGCVSVRLRLCVREIDWHSYRGRYALIAHAFAPRALLKMPVSHVGFSLSAAHRSRAPQRCCCSVCAPALRRDEPVPCTSGLLQRNAGVGAKSIQPCTRAQMAASARTANLACKSTTFYCAAVCFGWCVAVPQRTLAPPSPTMARSHAPLAPNEQLLVW